jgi:hypothetical protein
MSEYQFHHLGCGCGCNDYLRNPKDAEIGRLRNEILDHIYHEARLRKLITELCDALRESRLTRTGDKCVEFWQGVDVLLQRAREATR